MVRRGTTVGSGGGLARLGRCVGPRGVRIPRALLVVGGQADRRLVVGPDRDRPTCAPASPRDGHGRAGIRRRRVAHIAFVGV